MLIIFEISIPLKILQEALSSSQSIYDSTDSFDSFSLLCTRHLSLSSIQCSYIVGRPTQVWGCKGERSLRVHPWAQHALFLLLSRDMGGKWSCSCCLVGCYFRIGAKQYAAFSFSSHLRSFRYCPSGAAIQ